MPITNFQGVKILIPEHKNPDIGEIRISVTLAYMSIKYMGNGKNVGYDNISLFIFAENYFKSV